MTTTTLSTLAAKSARTGEIAHADLSGLVDALRGEAGTADDDMMEEDCQIVLGVLDGSHAPHSSAMKRVRAALLAGADDLDVAGHVDGNDVWEIWGVVDGSDFRVHLATR